MPNPLSFISTANRVFLFRSFVFDSSPQGVEQTLLSFRTLSEAELYQRLGDTQGDANKRVWGSVSNQEPDDMEMALKTAENEIHADLYPVVRRILLGSQNSVGGEFVGVPPFRLKSGVLSADFLLPLGQSGIKRLQAMAPAYSAAKYIPFRLSDVRVHLLGTGIGLLVWDLHFLNPFRNAEEASIPTEVVCEGLTALCRAYGGHSGLRPVKLEYRRAAEMLIIGQSVGLDERYTITNAENLASPIKSALLLEDCTQGQSGLVAFTHPLGCHPLRNWMDALIEPFMCTTIGSEKEVSGRNHERLFSYAAVQLPGGATVEDARRLSYRLAHKYTQDYQLIDEDVNDAIVRPFANVIHAMATQGGAVALVDNNSDFINNFTTQAVGMTYLPLAMLAHHEYLRLRAFTESDFRPTKLDYPNDELEDNLLQFQKDLTNFRLHYRFSHVSDLSNHNRVFQQWRKALSLDEMLRELSEDAAEGERVLTTLRQRREEKDRTLFSFVSCFAIFVLLADLAEVLARLFVQPPAEVMEVVKRAVVMLGKVPGQDDYKIAMSSLDAQLDKVISGLHCVHTLEILFFVVAVLIFLGAIWFVLRHRKSPVGGE